MHEMEERFHRFALKVPGAESVDDMTLGAEGRRADYLWRGRSVVVELKVLRGDPQLKVDRLFEEWGKRDDFPVVFGSVLATKVLQHLPDGNDLLLKLHQTVMRAVEDDFRAARRQIKNTKKLLGLDDPMGILVLMNPDIEGFDPLDLVPAISVLIEKRQESGWAIDAVWFLSEAHFMSGAQPCLFIESSKIDRFAWAEDFSTLLQKMWADFNNSPLITADESALKTLKVERASERQPRLLSLGEYRKAKYRANPYLSGLDDAALRKFGREAIEKHMEYFLVDGPHPRGTTPPEHVSQTLADFKEEAANRGLDMRDTSAEQT
ncbi:hypothetical protein [Luteimonas sp. MC1750]|uniref:hypothetical protein n=1 Tax=Luteimonas sp. MC1750 TaxID=2799326 RepID=UPI0018F0BE25|nr:hypothetical protein [Luteimonas sp. MC1750]MBJ6983990.1 hypothetical protein [Luteimonas sp. MC1750]QQO06802.1 hypothetical protein JGR68_05090 [Luteimonas sp. MC1750]